MHFASTKEAATYYISRGWQVVPLAPGKKNPVDDGWLKLVFTPDDFNPDDGIGIRSVNGIVVVDVDAPEAVQVADNFLPETGVVWGRRGKPRAKRVYASVFPKSVSLKDQENNAELVAIHSNHQDVAPPSLWRKIEEETGKVLDTQTLEWSGDIGVVATVEGVALMRAVRLLCTVAVISRYYAPPGGRHEWCLALSGLLRQLGLSNEESVRVIENAANVARDAKVSDRLTEVRTTYAKGDDEPIKAGKTLKEALGARNLATSLQKIWGTGSATFILDDKGERVLANNQENVRRALGKLDAELSFNVFSQKAIIKFNGYRGPLQDDVRNHLWLQIDEKFHFRPQPDFFDIVLSDTAHKREFHPVREYLSGIEWDGTERIETWLTRHANAADTPYVRAVSSLVLIAAVRRVMKPGCKFDELMVLESSQGKLKSSALRVLCPEDDWFSDDLPLNVDSKQIIERTLGKWIIEAADLSGMPKSQTEHLKATLSRQVDGPVRMAYGRMPVERPRQFVIIGTTNSHHYLRDGTGNRRFWPVRVTTFNVETLFKERDQLWAEAFKREREGASVRLLPALFEHAGLQQDRRRAIDAWELHLAEKLSTTEKHRLSQVEVWDHLGIPIAQRDDRGNERIHNIMQRLGFRRMSVRRSGLVVPGWGRDADQLSIDEEALQM